MASTTTRVIRYVAISDLSLIAFQTCLEHPEVHNYIVSQPWGATFLQSYQLIALGMNLDNFGVGLRQSFVAHIDEVIIKLKTENKIEEADELLRLKKTLSGTVDEGVEVGKGVLKMNELPKNILAKLSDESTKPKFSKDYFDDASEAFRKAVNAKPGLVDAWKAVKYCDDPALAAKATDIVELNLVSKYLDDITAAGGYKTWKAFDNLFSSSRQRAIAKFGKEAEELIYVKFRKDGGAAAEILDHYGTSGLNVLKKGGNFSEVVNELIKGQTAYRHISSKAGYLEQLKLSGNIPAQTGTGTTYFSLDKFDDPIQAIDKMQLNAKGTDAVWRVEFDASQLVDKVEIPKGKWNSAEYYEVLTKSNPDFGSGGASKFITQSEITIKRLVNLKTGEVYNF